MAIVLKDYASTRAMITYNPSNVFISFHAFLFSFVFLINA